MKTDKEMLEVLHYENLILELVDDQAEYTRSDLQGRAMAIAQLAINAGKKLSNN